MGAALAVQKSRQRVGVEPRDGADGMSGFGQLAQQPGAQHILLTIETMVSVGFLGRKGAVA